MEIILVSQNSAQWFNRPYALL